MGAVMRPVRTLLEGLIDYAGLFPPAQLDMATAVANYAGYRAGEFAWALGRFVVPATRLDEFEGAVAEKLARSVEASPWPVSLLGSADPAHDAELIFAFNERHAGPAAGRAVIDMLEVKASDLAALGRAVRSAPAGVATYVEFPIDDDPSDFVAALAAQGARAKVRTGGVTRDAFPAPDQLARFIRIAVDQGVPFKATAGLHHPIRAPYPLTYEPDSAVGVMYGHLNLFLAAAFAHGGLSLEELEAILEEGDPAAFRFDDSGVRWGTHHAGLETLSLLRTRMALSFGSCSFTEPVDELRALKLL
jgi:hypothetical protein